MPNEQAPKEFDASAVMAQLQALTERVAATEDENTRLKAALKEAQETGTFTDEFGNKVVILSSAMDSVNAGIHDKPGTLLEKLDIMEKQAKIRREPFDRERTRKILMGEEVTDLIEYVCPHCGRGDAKWNGNEDMFESHIEWHRHGGKEAAYPARKKIRAVDELVSTTIS